MGWPLGEIRMWGPWSALVIYGLLAVAAPLFDSWLVQWWYPDPETFAVFRYGAREFPLAATLAAALSAAMIPVCSSDLKSGAAELKMRVKRLQWLLYPIVIVLLFSSEPLFQFFFSEAFRPSAEIFNTYLLLTISQLFIVQPLVIGIGREKWLVKAAIIELMLNVIFSVLLGHYLGLQGIAAATVIAFMAEKLILARWLKRYHGIAPVSYFPRTGYVGAAVLIVCWYLALNI